MSRSIELLKGFFTKYLSSLKITLACFILAIVLIFIGTIYQLEYGAFAAQNNIFRAIFLYWHPGGSYFNIPFFPGGYFLGAVMLINLTAFLLFRLQFSLKRAGLYFIHLSIIFFVLGELLSGHFSSECILPIKVGEMKNYAFDVKHSSLVVAYHDVNRNDEMEIIFPESQLQLHNTLFAQDLPFRIYIHRIIPSEFSLVDKNGVKNLELEIEVLQDNRVLDKAMLSNHNEEGYSLICQNRKYRFSIEPERRYFPFKIELAEFKHIDHPGTQVPKSFSSLVRLYTKEGSFDRQAQITMNHPLKYNDRTFFQSGFAEGNGISIFQVVENPVWGMPYLSSALLMVGMLYQFGTGLYARKRRCCINHH